MPISLKGNHDQAVPKSAGYFNDAARASRNPAAASTVTANAPCGVHVVRVPERRPRTAPDPV